ncbi:hypothetical protein BC829DRAFT_492482 [Chytridium lagenaria]|nr:hypothetical protein BC829DRAFT_492482 [Chytridium lagenaria]
MSRCWWGAGAGAAAATDEGAAAATDGGAAAATDGDAAAATDEGAAAAAVGGAAAATDGGATAAAVGGAAAAAVGGAAAATDGGATAAAVGGAAGAAGGGWGAAAAAAFGAGHEYYNMGNGNGNEKSSCNGTVNEKDAVPHDGSFLMGSVDASAWASVKQDDDDDHDEKTKENAHGGKETNDHTHGDAHDLRETNDQSHGGRETNVHDDHDDDGNAVDVFAWFIKKITGKRFLLNEDGIIAVEQLVNHFDLNLAIVQPKLDSNTLLSAIAAGNVTYIEYLLNHPQVIQADLVNTALLDEPEIVRLLLNHGADINAEILQDSKDPNSPRFTLLQYLIFRQRPLGIWCTSPHVWAAVEHLKWVGKEPPTGVFGRSLGTGLFDVVPGTCHWETELIEFPAWGEPVKARSVAVDGGRVAILDALKWIAAVKAGTDGDICGLGSHGEAVGTFGVVVSSGDGDGIYPDHVRKTTDMVVGVRVEFLDDGFTQPDTPQREVAPLCNWCIDVSSVVYCILTPMFL